MSQGDLFERTPPRVCGACVVRNAESETTLYGECSRTDAPQHRDAPACVDWFGLEQLRAPLYGRRAA